MPTNQDPGSMLMFVFLLVGPLVLMVLLMRERSERKEQAKAAIVAAARLGFSFTKEMMINIPALLFPGGQQARNVVSGTYRGYKTSLFSYEYAIPHLSSVRINGSRMSKQQYTFCILHYSSVFPHIVLTSVLDQGQSLFPGLKKDSLEGGFDKVFNMYLENGAQLTVREMFPPDKMLTLIRDFSSDSIEFVGPYIIVMRAGFLFTTDEYEQFFKKCTMLFDLSL
jgi:hypothetical protein